MKKKHENLNRPVFDATIESVNQDKIYCQDCDYYFIEDDLYDGKYFPGWGKPFKCPECGN